MSINKDLGFSYEKQLDDYHVYRKGKKITVLRGDKAIKFEQALEFADINSQQQLMAKLTGNYKRGNEGLATKHPRNRPER